MTEKIATTEVSSRRLLKRLRDVMLQDTAIQDKLKSIVSVVASEMGTPVCSFYLLQPGDILELYATYGLNPKSIHETKLRTGEGLIGEVAIQKKALSFEDAQNHPSFAYKPETDEDDFKSLLGAPVLLGEHLIGVIAVQKEEQHNYTEEEIELLETVSMLLGQMLASVKFENKQESILHTPKDNHDKLEGERLVAGMGLGKVFVYSRLERVSNMVAGQESQELEKLKVGLEEMDKELSNLLSSPNMSAESLDVFETYKMFTKDKGWIAKITDYIHSGLTAEAAVQKVGDDMYNRMQMISDPYLKERVHDFQDLANRLQRHLIGKQTITSDVQLDDNTILVAKSMGPAELLDFDRSKIKAVLLEEGSPTMHVVIVAKSLNIPIVGNLHDLLGKVQNGDTVAVDAENGQVYINPADNILADFNKRIEALEKIRRKYGRIKNLPCETLDGVQISLNLNAGLSMDVFALGEGFAEGVGLYRTELPFMSSGQLPDTQQQIEMYKRVLEKADGKPVIFRTLDIGSDKVLPYAEYKKEENPAMGWRSIRVTLDRRSLLRQQLRAFIRAVNGGDLYVMFPMITDIDEFIQAKETLNIELEREAQKGGVLPASIHTGTMLEVPALLFQMAEFLPLVDFVSIGTNDLSQFLFAKDRSDTTVWEKYDVLSAPMLRALKYVADMCRLYKVPVSVCGEMAGHPLDAMVLIALGYRKLSMNPASLGPVKSMILSMDTKQVSEYVASVLGAKTRSLRERLRLYALDHNIAI